MSQPQSHFVTLNDLRLHYLDWGTAGQHPFIFCHGGSAHARWWDFIAPAFTELPNGKWTAKLDRRTLLREPIDGWSLLPRIGCPTLIVKAQHSPVLTPKKLERMCTGLPNSRWVEVPHTYHHVMLDNPDGFISVVREFLHEVL